MSCFGICKTAQIPVGVMPMVFFQTMHFFLPRVYGIESWDIFKFSSVPSNVLKMISHQNIKWLGNGNQSLETMSGENCQIFRISQFSWVDMHSNIFKLWEYGEEFWNRVFCILSSGALSRLCMNPDLPKDTLIKKKCNIPTFLKGTFPLLYMYSNFWVFWNGFLNIVSKSIGKMKYSTKFIYLHSSAKETQLSTVHFFWDWVYI